MKPKLRFQGFHDDWEEKKLGEVAESIIGMTYSPDDLVNEQEGIWVLRSSNVQNDRIIKQDDKYISMEIPNKKMIKENDILLCSRNGSRDLIGKCAYISDTFLATFGAFMTVIRSPYNKFIVQNLRTIQFKKYIHSHLGATINQITNKDLGLYTLFLPSLPEQEKIGTFLSQLDDRIEKQEQKIALLKERKKGWMQQLFSQTIRFKDESGQDYPAWEEKKLEELLLEKIDNRGKTPNNQTTITNHPLLEVNSLGRLHIDYSKVSKYVNDEIYNSKFRKHIKKGDILFSTVGNTALCSYYLEEKEACIAQNIVGFRFNLKNSSKFMFYMFSFFDNYKKMRSIEMGAVQPSIKVSQLVKISFLLPSLPEQEKIAEFLAKQDELIEKEEEKLSLLKEQKKGLLQQMFV